jgi:hypothetical protein
MPGSPSRVRHVCRAPTARTLGSNGLQTTPHDGWTSTTRLPSLITDTRIRRPSPTCPEPAPKRRLPAAATTPAVSTTRRPVGATIIKLSSPLLGAAIRAHAFPPRVAMARVEILPPILMKTGPRRKRCNLWVLGFQQRLSTLAAARLLCDYPSPARTVQAGPLTGTCATRPDSTTADAHQDLTRAHQQEMLEPWNFVGARRRLTSRTHAVLNLEDDLFDGCGSC